MFTNDLDQVGGPHQFWRTTACRDKEPFMSNFMTNDFRRATSQLAVARWARGFDHAKAAWHCQAHRHGGQK